MIALQEGDSGGTEIFQLQNGGIGVCNFLQLEHAVVVDSSDILLDEFEVLHSLHNFFFLLQTGFDCAGINFFFEDEFDVVAGIVLSVADEIEMVQGTHQTQPKLLEFAVNAIFEMP